MAVHQLPCANKENEEKVGWPMQEFGRVQGRQRGDVRRTFQGEGRASGWQNVGGKQS